ncbi:Mor transcription activator family protein [Vibrio hepatarius]|uniref:Mor transcription activator family protein n=1 Tax=Vibrio hepatarius TaxID=171383 RepID=UPI00148D27DD|nr:Mor transcription activator family protein [Vibrio hepatarius]NOI14817.1 transcriptional regulator [Vibrio hepatarius]
MSKAEQNLEMFGMEELSMDDVDSILVEEEAERWPEAVRQMYDVFKAELKKAGADESIAINLISATCQNFGGMQFYLGRGTALERHLRNLRIWHDFNGNNVPELIKKYDVSYSQVYRLIAKMRSREVKKRQPDLF